MVGTLPDVFLAINGTFVLGLPITAFHVLAITLILRVVLDCTPIGRYRCSIGANQRAAEQNGISKQVRHRGLCHRGRTDGAGGGPAGMEAADRAGLGGAGIPAARAGGRVPWIDHDQAGEVSWVSRWRNR